VSLVTHVPAGVSSTAVASPAPSASNRSATAETGTAWNPAGGVLPISEVLVEAIDNMATRSGEMRRRERTDLIEWLVEEVRDAAMDQSIPARAADAVLDGRLDESELMRISGVVARKRRAKEIRDTPGAYFLWLLRRCLGHDLKGGLA